MTNAAISEELGTDRECADSGNQGHRPDIPSRDPAKEHRLTAAVLQMLQASLAIKQAILIRRDLEQ